ncbi:hypothetical protein PROAA_10020 [Candidatus Propionivibrio aalborgensis]|uniref:Uncharacterized protein n=1 Tax=Candidatus Propionivibrio aalborgensis TaxID=1860101 RepID=A0A1A8XGW3_9RHOO|nr:hypothetical protein PROAA_10020 [Candidatus Propionivibrio aalborgensis]
MFGADTEWVREMLRNAYPGLSAKWSSDIISDLIDHPSQETSYGKPALKDCHSHRRCRYHRPWRRNESCQGLPARRGDG